MGHPVAVRAGERPPMKVGARELIDRHDCARLLSVSASSISNWCREGLMPGPVEIRGMVLWRRREIEDWAMAGCPPRNDWKWERAVVVQLPAFIETLKDQAVELGQLIRQLEERAAAGEKTAMVRRV